MRSRQSGRSDDACWGTRRHSTVTSIFPTGQIVACAPPHQGPWRPETFIRVLAKLRCRQCGNPPAPVYLCAGHREHTMGTPPGLGHRAGASVLAPGQR